MPTFKSFFVPMRYGCKKKLYFYKLANCQCNYFERNVLIGRTIYSMHYSSFDKHALIAYLFPQCACLKYETKSTDHTTKMEITSYLLPMYLFNLQAVYSLKHDNATRELKFNETQNTWKLNFTLRHVPRESSSFCFYLREPLSVAALL